MQTHKSLKHFEKAIRKRQKCPDLVKIGNVIFTMQEYDESGKTITYGNKRTETGFSVETEDRYNKDLGFKDAEIEGYDEWFLRNDISYYD